MAKTISKEVGVLKKTALCAGCILAMFFSGVIHADSARQSCMNLYKHSIYLNILDDAPPGATELWLNKEVEKRWEETKRDAFEIKKMRRCEADFKSDPQARKVFDCILNAKTRPQAKACG